MAYATLTILKDGEDVWGGRCRAVTGSLALDDDYPTNGYPLPLTRFGLKQVWNVIIGTAGDAAAGVYTYFYDVSTQKLLVFLSGVEVSPSGDLSAVTALRITMIGR